MVQATDETLQRDVAIKFFRPGGSAEPAPRHLIEVRAMARVRHDNVIALHATGRFEGAPYAVMELVDGTDLATWLQRREPLPVARALSLLAQLCHGVDAIHEAGAVHHDLKPANVMVGPELRLAIGDFGMASILTPTTGVRAGGGSPAYMAPELIRGAMLSAESARRADIYALGITAFELLTGRLPYQSDSLECLLRMQCHAEPPRPSSTRRQLPPELDAPLAKALAKDPSERPASGSAFLSTLQSIPSEEP